MKVYPNPASDFLIITNPPGKEILRLTIFDETGRPSLHQEIESGGIGECKIDLSDFAPGLYFFELENNNGKQIKTGKLLVVKP